MPGKFLLWFSCASCLIVLSASNAAAQGDTIKQEKKKLFPRIVERVTNAITISKKDSALSDTTLNTQSETPFKSFEGKVIRFITTQELGFEITFLDTSKRINYFGTRLLNSLHAGLRKKRTEK